jgi:hypothetical protein
MRTDRMERDGRFEGGRFGGREHSYLVAAWRHRRVFIGHDANLPSSLVVEYFVHRRRSVVLWCS